MENHGNISSWSSYYRNVLYPILSQSEDVCWKIYLIRQLNALLRIQDYLMEGEILSSQIIFYIMPHFQCTEAEQMFIPYEFDRISNGNEWYLKAYAH